MDLELAYARWVLGRYPAEELSGADKRSEMNSLRGEFILDVFSKFFRTTDY